MSRKAKSKSAIRKRDRERKRQERNINKEKISCDFSWNDEAIQNNIPHGVSKTEPDSLAKNEQQGTRNGDIAEIVVQGSFHQGSSIFTDESRGRQCSCNAIVGICLLRTTPCSQDIDNALFFGDQLYTATIANLQAMMKFKNYYLNIDEILTAFTINNKSFTLKKLCSVYGTVHHDDQSGTLGISLENSLSDLFEKFDSSILILKDYTIAVFRNVEGLYVLFDSHSRNIHGTASLRGKSIWMSFKRIVSLISQIRKLASSIANENFQYELTPVIISNESIKSQDDTPVEKPCFLPKNKGKLNTPVDSSQKRKIFLARIRYRNNKTFRQNKIDLSKAKYVNDESYRDKLKGKSKIKYKTCPDHRKMKKRASLTKYATDWDHRKKIKRASVSKYASDKNFRKKLKEMRRIKYKECHTHRHQQLQNSKKQYHDLKKKQEGFDYCIERFKEACNDGPSHVCIVCKRLHFRNGVLLYQKRTCEKIQMSLKSRYVHDCSDTCQDNCALKLSSYGKEWICHTCNRYIKKERMPPEAEENELYLDDIPEELLNLNGLENQLVALMIPFAKMVNLPRGGHKGIIGPTVCVPSDISKVQQVIPRTTSEAQLIKLKLKRKLCYKGHYNYQTISLEKVKRAICYLKQNNSFYKDVIIDLKWFNNINDELLEDNAGESSLTPNMSNSMEEYNTDNHPTKTKGEEYIEVETAILQDTCLQPVDLAAEPEVLQKAMDNIYNIAPCEGQKPVNIFSLPSNEQKSFPGLFPTGKYGFDYKRSKKLTLNKYFKSRIMNADSRFAKNTSYIFFAQYMSEYKQVCDSISIALRKSNEKTKDGNKITAKMFTTAEDVQNIVRSNAGYRFLQPIRGTPSYWERTLRDLFASVRQLDIPTWFATFSAADFRWPEIVTVIALQQGQTVDFSKLDWSEKCEFLKVNPVTAARMFDHRIHSFFKEIIKSPLQPIGKVIDYFYRVEFQARGSPHIHCLFWVDNAPKYGKNYDNEFIDFVDKYSTCRLPDKETEPELYEIVTSVQMHNHSHTCKKENKECRFGFPKPPSSRTFITKPKIIKQQDQDFDPVLHAVNLASEKRSAQAKLNDLKTVLCDEKRQNLNIESVLQAAGMDTQSFESTYNAASNRESIVLRRNVNECWVNNYNEQLLLAWNANIDFQPVFDAHACIMYILSYISKSERAMSELLETVNKEAEENNISVKEQMRMVGSAYLTHREVSVQEAVYRVLGMNMKHFTRETIFVPAHPSCTRITLPLEQMKKKAADDDENPWQPNLIDKYISRPLTDTFHDMCLADFAAKYRTVQSKTDLSLASGEQRNTPQTYTLQNKLGTIRERLRSNDAVIRYPKFSKSKRSEDYHLVLLKLYLPHRQENHLKPPNFDTYEFFYQNGTVKLSGSQDIQYVKEIVELNRVHYETNAEEIDQAENVYFSSGDLEDAWANLAPNTKPSQLEEEDEAFMLVDENEDKLIVELGDCVQLQCDQRVNTDERIIQNTRDLRHSTTDVLSKMRKMNRQQQEVFYSVRKWCKLKSQGQQPDPFFVFVHSSGGCGKSFLIDMLHFEASKILEGSVDQKKVLLTAPTGVAAFGINGYTLHKAFHLPVKMKLPYIPLGEDIANTLRFELGELQILIIDEISMVSRVMLSYIHGRLTQIKQSPRDFGGVCVIALGDFYQLPPVKGIALYRPCKDLIDLWGDNFKLVTLTKIMRQSDISDAELMNRVRIKKQDEQLNVEDFRRLKSRSNLNYVPKNALHVFSRNKDVNSHNQKLLEATCTDTKILKAEDTVKYKGQKYRKGQPIKGSSNDLSDEIEVGINAKVMLTRNVDLVQGLVNGATGVISAILMNEDDSMCQAVCVKFYNSLVGLQEKVKVANDKRVPQDSVCIYRCEETMENGAVVRQQFPLKLAFACTIHKVQGLTTEEIVVCLNGIFAPGMAYVALSRIKSLDGLYILGKIDTEMKCIYCCEEIQQHLNSLHNFDMSFYRDLEEKSIELMIVHHNVEGVEAHVEDLKGNLQITCADVICLSETWLKRNLSMDKCLVGYTFIGKCRQECSYYGPEAVNGGVGIFVKDHIKFEEILVTTMKSIEAQAILIKHLSILIVTVYRSPTYPKYEFAKILENILIDIQNLYNVDTIVITGDLNENLLADEIKLLRNILYMYNFKQFIEECTTSGSSLLDLIFVKSKYNFECGVLQSYYGCHEPIYCKLFKTIF